jgi:hypothetical protein
MSPAHSVVAMLQSVAGSVGDQVDLNTVLLTILLGLGTWTLIAVHQHAVTIGRVSERVWGTDGRGGHEGELQKLKADVDALRGALGDIQLGLRMKRRRRDAVLLDPPETE